MDDSAKTPGENTGVLPPMTEENNAQFEDVNAANDDTDTPLGDAPDALEVPATTVSELPNIPSTFNSAMPSVKGKRQQTAAQKETIQRQAEERQKLKNAGVAKPSVAMVATLASKKAKGDPSYDSIFANAVAGKPLTQYRAPKTAKKGRNSTVLNTTMRNNAPMNMAANVRANNGAAKNTIDSIQAMGETAISTVREMMRLSTTLTKELAKTNNTAGLAAASEWKSNLAPLSSLRNMTRAKPKKPRASRKKTAGPMNSLTAPSLPAIPEGMENNTFEAVR